MEAPLTLPLSSRVRRDSLSSGRLPIILVDTVRERERERESIHLQQGSHRHSPRTSYETLVPEFHLSPIARLRLPALLPSLAWAINFSTRSQSWRTPLHLRHRSFRCRAFCCTLDDDDGGDDGSGVLYVGGGGALNALKGNNQKHTKTHKDR